MRGNLTAEQCAATLWLDLLLQLVQSFLVGMNIGHVRVLEHNRRGIFSARIHEPTQKSKPENLTLF